MNETFVGLLTITYPKLWTCSWLVGMQQEPPQHAGQTHEHMNIRYIHFYSVVFKNNKFQIHLLII